MSTRRINLVKLNNPDKLGEVLRQLPKFMAMRIEGENVEIEFDASATAQEEQAIRDAVNNHNPADLSLSQQERQFLQNLPADELTWTDAQVRRILKGLLKRALLG